MFCLHSSTTLWNILVLSFILTINSLLCIVYLFLEEIVAISSQFIDGTQRSFHDRIADTNEIARTKIARAFSMSASQGLMVQNTGSDLYPKM